MESIMLPRTLATRNDEFFKPFAGDMSDQLVGLQYISFKQQFIGALQTKGIYSVMDETRYWGPDTRPPATIEPRPILDIPYSAEVLSELNPAPRSNALQINHKAEELFNKRIESWRKREHLHQEMSTQALGFFKALIEQGSSAWTKLHEYESAARVVDPDPHSVFKSVLHEFDKLYGNGTQTSISNCRRLLTEATDTRYLITTERAQFWTTITCYLASFPEQGISHPELTNIWITGTSAELMRAQVILPYQMELTATPPKCLPKEWSELANAMNNLHLSQVQWQANQATRTTSSAVGSTTITANAANTSVMPAGGWPCSICGNSGHSYKVCFANTCVDCSLALNNGNRKHHKGDLCPTRALRAGRPTKVNTHQSSRGSGGHGSGSFQKGTQPNHKKRKAEAQLHAAERTKIANEAATKAVAAYVASTKPSPS